MHQSENRFHNLPKHLWQTFINPLTTGLTRPFCFAIQFWPACKWDKSNLKKYVNVHEFCKWKRWRILISFMTLLKHIALMYHITIIWCQTGGEALVSCGIMESLLRVINWLDDDGQDHITVSQCRILRLAVDKFDTYDASVSYHMSALFLNANERIKQQFRCRTRWRVLENMCCVLVCYPRSPCGRPNHKSGHAGFPGARWNGGFYQPASGA